MEEWNEDFAAFINALDSHNLRFLIVGGYAVAFHGYARYSGALDFFVAVDAANAAGLVAAFQDFGFGSLGLTEIDFLAPNLVIEIGREPRKIQVLTGIDGVEFEEAFENHETHALRDQSVPIISKADLIRNKRASGRPKDLLDVEELERKV